MATPGPVITRVAEGTAEHPRNGGAVLLDRKDGSFLLFHMMAYSSDLQLVAGDDAPHDIVRLESFDGGDTWQNQQMVIAREPGETATYSPTFCRLKNGKLMFRYERLHHFVKDEPWRLSSYAVFTEDECETFSDPVVIVDNSPHLCGSQGDIRQLSTGRIIIPTCYMEGDALQDDGEGLAPSNTSKAGAVYSDDDGQTWQVCDGFIYLPMRGAMEPKIEELKDGRLLMVMRTQLGSVFQSFSEDGGSTWSNAQTTGLQSPESCPGLIRIPQTGDLMLIWNDSPYRPKFDHYGIRSPLAVAISKDDGRTWLPSKNIEHDPEWEFTNPTAIVTQDGTMMILYEASKYQSLVPPGALGRTRMHLHLARVHIDWLYE
jgi:sialidase-1